MKNAIIFIIALAVSGIALAESHAQIHGKYAAPFGLEWGLSKEQVTAMGVKLTPHKSAKDTYTAKTLPKNLSDGEAYYLIFKQGFGLVAIGVVTNNITRDPLGSKGIERYSQLKTAIVNKYGKPDDEFERALRNQFYECLKHEGCGSWASFWASGTDGVIALELRGLTRGIGYIELKYESAALYIAAEQEEAEKSRSDEDSL